MGGGGEFEWIDSETDKKNALQILKKELRGLQGRE